MRIAVTGTSGFIGKKVVAALRASAHEVRVLDRAATGDIAAVADWSPHVAGMDAVVHLAALAHARNVNESELRSVNVNASVAIGRAAAATGARMVFLSTVKVLGEEGMFDDQSPFAPQDTYARAKADAEQGLRAIAGLRLCVLRPPLVYGPGVGANFMALLRAVARGWPLPLASVKNARSLVGVDNLAHAIACVAESARADGKTFLVADGEPVSTPDLCRAIGGALGRGARLLPFPPSLLELLPAARKLTRSLVVDHGRIRRELAWTPPHSFKAELQVTAEWYRTQGS